MALTMPKASQINFDLTNISDPIIRLNSGESGSADKDTGIVLERGSDTNVALLYDESANQFALVNTNEDGTTSGNVTIASYAPVKLSNLVIADAGNIGSASDTDAIAISSGGVVTMNQIPVFSAGINVSGGTIAGTLATAAQTNITSLGTLTALTVDDVAINGKVMTMTGSSSDTAVFTVGTNGTLSIVTTDIAAAAANIQITADGTAELAGTTVTLDSSGGITLDADNGTITFADAGVSLGTITSSGYTGNVVGNVTGNVSGTAATVTTAAQTNITSLGTLTTLTVDNIIINGANIGHTSDTDSIAIAADGVVTMNQIPVFSAGINVSGGTIAGTLATAAQTNITTVGTLTALQVDNININGNAITSTAGIDLTITPLAGQQIVLDGTIVVDAGVVTGATSITSTAFVGDLTGDVTGNADTFTATANNSTNETVYPVFVDGATGTQGAETDTGLTYNPSTGLLTSTGFSGNLTGTLQTAAQGNVTSLGTLTTLTVDNIIINGTNIGHTSDTDAIAIAADGKVTFSQETTVTTAITLNAQADLRFADADSSNWLAFQAPNTVGSNVTWTLPSADGTEDQVLSTNGSGTLAWADAGSGGSSSASSYPNSTVSTMPGSAGNYDLGKNTAQDTAETPFEAGGADAFGVNLGTVYSMMDPAGTTTTVDLGTM